MKLLLSSLGTSGDIVPLLGIGREMVRRGHSVHLAANEHFRDTTETMGLQFHALGDREHYDRANQSQWKYHPRRSFRIFAEALVLPSMRPLYSWIQSHANDPNTVMATTGYCLGARIARDTFSIPFATIHLQPNIFRSAYQSPVMMGIQLPGLIPRSIKRSIILAGHALFINPVLRQDINQFRAELGLPALTNPLDQWWHSPDLVLAMFPDWFAKAQPDWPTTTIHTGFPCFKINESTELEKDLETFLQSGPAPILFTYGSCVFHQKPFFQASLDAILETGKRAIFLSHDPDSLPSHSPKEVFNLSFAPFSQLLPRCSAIVHHGGIGTASMTMQAGIPQLILPTGMDQPDNAARMKSLGVAHVESPKRYNHGDANHILTTFLADQTLQAPCETLKKRMSQHQGISKACDQLERLQP